MLAEALKTLLAVAENYPQLRAVENFTQLQTDLSQLEEQVQFAPVTTTPWSRDLTHGWRNSPQISSRPCSGFKAREFFETGSAAEREGPRGEVRHIGSVDSEG